MASNSPTISIKLLIDQETKTVILAEASNAFVDTLRSFLTFPLGNIVRLVDKHQGLQPGCFNNIYKSVENPRMKCFRTKACRQMLLYPRNVHEEELKSLKVNFDLTVPTKYFVCGICCKRPDGVLSYYRTSNCTCVSWNDKEAAWGSDLVKDKSEGVLYKGESTFFITDDLRVMQGTMPGDLIKLLLGLGIKNVCKLEEKVFQLGSEEMTNLLSHLFISNTTLTDVFLKEQGCPSSTSISVEHFLHVAPNEKETSEQVSKTRVKIMMRKSDKKILYAEANEDFVDLLFSFLTIPLESVLELVGGKGNLTLGSLSKLFKELDNIYSITKQKDPQKGVLPPFYSCPKEFPNIFSRDAPTYYSYPSPGKYYLTSENSVTRTPLKLVDPKSPQPDTTNSSGYVERNSLFVVTDDLVVKAALSFSIISFLMELGIPLDDVEEQVISIGEVEAVSLLRASLCSSSALSALVNVNAKQPKQEPL